jgi:hypothetical protein
MSTVFKVKILEHLEEVNVNVMFSDNECSCLGSPYDNSMSLGGTQQNKTWEVVVVKTVEVLQSDVLLWLCL